MAIAFVEHPCSTEEKKKYMLKGFKVIDVKFKPEKLEDGDKIFMKPKAKQD